MKGGYCLGALFFNLSCRSNFNLPFYCLKVDFHCPVILYVRTHVNFTRVNTIETMNGRLRVNVKVEPSSTFMFARGLSYMASFSFTRVNFTCVRTEKYATVESNLLIPFFQRAYYLLLVLQLQCLKLMQ